jgi:shikimate kinase
LPAPIKPIKYILFLFQALLNEREDLYLSCADFVIDSGQMQSKLAVKEILKEYSEKYN